MIQTTLYKHWKGNSQSNSSISFWIYLLLQSSCMYSKSSIAANIQSITTKIHSRLQSVQCLNTAASCNQDTVKTMPVQYTLCLGKKTNWLGMLQLSCPSSNFWQKCSWESKLSNHDLLFHLSTTWGNMNPRNCVFSFKHCCFTNKQGNTLNYHLITAEPQLIISTISQ